MRDHLYNIHNLLYIFPIFSEYKYYTLDTTFIYIKYKAHLCAICALPYAHYFILIPLFYLENSKCLCM